MEQLGELVGTDASTINKLEKGRTRLSPKWISLLVKELGVSADALLGTGQPSPAELRRADVPAPMTNRLPTDVPVKGTAAGSLARGAFQLDVDTIVDYVRRPPALMNARHAYALFVEGTSMEPRYFPGDLIFVHPDRPPRFGDTVVVQIRMGEHHPIEASIGVLRRRTGSHLVIGKLNPPDTEVSLKAETVIAVHKVLNTNDLFGV